MKNNTFDIYPLFTFSESQYVEFRKFLLVLNSQGWGKWPQPEKWPRYEGMPPYTIQQFKRGTNKYGDPMTYLLIYFDYAVATKNDMSRIFKFGGKNRHKPFRCPKF